MTMKFTKEFFQECGRKGGSKCSAKKLRACRINGKKGGFKKGYTPWNKGKKQISIAEENHPQWKGDAVGYSGVHQWLRRKYGNANKCENKDCEGISKSYDWANLSGKYKRDRTDFMMLCKSCHSHHDYKKFGIKWGRK